MFAFWDLRTDKKKEADAEDQISKLSRDLRRLRGQHSGQTLYQSSWLRHGFPVNNLPAGPVRGMAAREGVFDQLSVLYVWNWAIWQRTVDQNDGSYLRHYCLRCSTWLVLDIQTQRCGLTENSCRSLLDATISWRYRYLLWACSSIRVHLRRCRHSMQGSCRLCDGCTLAWTFGALCNREVRSGPVQGRSAEIRKS